MWYVYLQFAAGQGRPRAVEGGIAPGAGPPLTSFPIIPVQHENPFVGPIGKLLLCCSLMSTKFIREIQHSCHRYICDSLYADCKQCQLSHLVM